MQTRTALRWFVTLSFVLFVMNAFVPTSIGQQTQSHLLVQEVLEGSALELVEIPDQFYFKPAGVTGVEQYRFHTVENSQGKTSLKVRDDRNRGGFKVFLEIQPISATHRKDVENPEERVPLKKTKYISNQNLALVTTATGPKVSNGVEYSENSQGPANISAPWDASGQNLTVFKTYDQKGTNLVTSPVLLMDGTLPANQGRVGEFALDVNYGLKIKKFQPAGSYQMQFVYTVVDSTE